MSNIDIRSFVLNAEATIILHDQAVIAELGGAAALSAREPEHWAARSALTKRAGNLAKLLSPLL